MYQYADKAQDFVNQWTTRMGLPYLEVKVSNYNSPFAKAMLRCEKNPRLVLFRYNIRSRKEFVLTLLHEICHWWYYWRFNDDRYISERKVIVQSYGLVKRYYPSYFLFALQYAVGWVQREINHHLDDEYYGYLDVLKRFGAIKDVKKVTE